MGNGHSRTNDKHTAVDGRIGCLQLILRAALTLRNLWAVVTSHDSVWLGSRIIAGRGIAICARSGVEVGIGIGLRDRVTVDGLVRAFDIRPLSTEVLRELVAGARLVWGELDRSDICRICLVHVEQTTRPTPYTFGTVRITGVPDAKMKSRRTLRISIVTISLVLVLQGPNNFAVDQPLDSLFGPVVGVRVE